MPLLSMLSLGDLATDRAPGTEDTLRSISEPSEPRRTRQQPDNDFIPWPSYRNTGANLPRG